MRLRMSTAVRRLFAVLICLGALVPRPSAAVDPAWTTLELVADGFWDPIDIAVPDDGSGRLFVVEKRGVVRVVRDGRARATPFLDITDRVLAADFEQGLFSLAFHPDFATNGTFFVSYSSHDGEWRLERYQVTDDPNVADPSGATTILAIPHPDNEHYGGELVFGPDGYLWVSVGDGGGAFDPYGNAQRLDRLLGKLLRIDIDGATPYAIPPDNPFVGRPDARPEIWAYGLRNPWRFSFDRLTGDLWIGDVGQGEWEEVDRQPAGAPGGQNYGWPLLEGMQCSLLVPDCDPSRYVAPVFQYGRQAGCAIVGGHVYRGDPASPLYGRYLFSDYCRGSIWALHDDGDGDVQAVELLATGLQVGSFGEGPDGELYLTTFSGGVYRLTVARTTPVPVLHGAVPAALLAGGVDCGVQLLGWHFTSGASVRIDGTDRPARFIDSAHLAVTLTAQDMAVPHHVEIAVVNPNGATSAPLAIPIEEGDGLGVVSSRWARSELPVAQGAVARTWEWGPSGLGCPFSEPYRDAPGGARWVQYFDKGRMEVGDPNGDPTSAWYVTTGLLATELITGAVQLGADLFEQREPADLPVAGDEDDLTGPTYRTFGTLRAVAPAAPGTLVTLRVDRAATVWDDPGTAAYAVTVATVDPVTDHAIAAPFWDYMSAAGPVYQDGQIVDAALFPDPLYATGRPLSEAYWARVTVAGSAQDVLVQCFERRCLTYTPANPPAWRVEAGNIGRHYYLWRYGKLPP